jgi:hypothetical protein
MMFDRYLNIRLLYSVKFKCDACFSSTFPPKNCVLYSIRTNTEQEYSAGICRQSMGAIGTEY